MAMMMMMMVTMLLVTETRGDGGHCEEIQIPMCKDIGYNFTRLPNEFNHESQDEVSRYLTKKQCNFSDYKSDLLLNLTSYFDMIAWQGSYKFV